MLLWSLNLGFAAGVSIAANTLTSTDLKNDTGTVQANETGMIVYVYSRTDGTLVLKSTSQTTDGSGIWQRTDAGNYVSSTTYLVVFELSTGTDFGAELLTAT